MGRLRWMAPLNTEMEEGDLRSIVEAGERIIRKVGMRVDGTEEFNGYLRDFGCEIDGAWVRFPEAVISKTMSRIADRKRNNPPRERVPPKEVTFSASGQALWCCDPETDRIRAATKKDLADLCRVIESVDGLDRTHPTFIPQDAPLRTRELHAFVTILLNSVRPYRVSAYSVEILPYFLEALRVACGSEDRAKATFRALLPAKVWINSPFMISRENIEAPMLLRRLTGQPLVFNSMPVAGAATPVTIAGSLAQITAEVIGANALSMAVNGDLCGWIAGPLGFDMKVGVHTQWGAETVFLQAGGAHVAAHTFGGTPTFNALPTTAAKTPGEQSAMEKSFHAGLAFMAGARSFGSLGTLAFADVGSAVQLMLDVELVSAIRRLAQGFEVDAERIAEEVILEVAPRGAYFLEHEHTLRHFRKEQWLPELMDRRIVSAWVNDPRTMLDNARDKTLRLIREAPNRCPLSEGQRRELQSVLDAADREMGG